MGVMTFNNKAEPFLKWAGGKSQLLAQFNRFIPEKFNNYIEPFVGGGALFFHLYITGLLADCDKVVLIDSNDELINCYRVIKENPGQLIESLHDSGYINEPETYYEIRAQKPHNDIERAARTLYLNKTCFNGLYRVNSKGEFNVPFGRYRNPSIYNEEKIEAVSESLKNVELICGDFSRCSDYAHKDDFIYFDPPYQPLSPTANFTSYTMKSFDESEQVRLSVMFRELDKKGSLLMLSNSYTSFIKELYNGFQINVVQARRAINCKPEGRGRIGELVITNYPVESERMSDIPNNQDSIPRMSFKRNGEVHQPLKTIRVNGETILAIYAGSLSEFDVLIKYRQKQKDGKWSAIRTPKHIHWTVDILMKMQTYKELTAEFVDFFIRVWETTKPLTSEIERQSIDLEALLRLSEEEISKFKELSKKGEYSVRFLILLAKLLMLQEKTNRADAYMFRNVLEGLKTGEDLFRILSAATLGANRGR